MLTNIINTIRRRPEPVLTAKESTMRTRVYLACPMTSSGDLKENVENAIEVGKQLISEGYAPLVPALSHYMDPNNQIPHAVWMSVDDVWVRQADALLRMPGESRGADIECRIASEAGIPVFESMQDLDEWEKQRRRNPAVTDAVTDKPDTVKFSTGAVRSSDAEGTRYDLVTPIGLRRVAEAYAEGARKYSAHNCEKGMPIHDLLNHAIRHAFTYLAGDRSEDHLGHAAWGFMMACHSEELWPHLNEGTLRGPGCVAPKAG